MIVHSNGVELDCKNNMGLTPAVGAPVSLTLRNFQSSILSKNSLMMLAEHAGRSARARGIHTQAARRRCCAKATR